MYLFLLIGLAVFLIWQTAVLADEQEASLIDDETGVVSSVISEKSGLIDDELGLLSDDKRLESKSNLLNSELRRKKRSRLRTLKISRPSWGRNRHDRSGK